MRKRMFDAVAAGLALVLLSPFLALLALIVRLDSRGPALFTQDRVGRHGKLFRIVKFRSMRHQPDTGEIALPGDARITRFGKILRSTHLDELPQLWNVLIGEMSLVGPRPDVPVHARKYHQERVLYQKRLSIRPGITGLSQLQGRMKVLRLGARYVLRCDQLYIRNQSIMLDLWILACTIQVVLLRKGV